MSWTCPKCERELPWRDFRHYCQRVSLNTLFDGRSEELILVFDKILAEVADWPKVLISTTPNCIVFYRRTVKLITDRESGKKTGFGFIEMPVREQAQSAIAALHDKEIYRRKLALSEAVEKEPQKESNFQRPRREYRSGGSNEEIDGNRW